MKNIKTNTVKKAKNIVIKIGTSILTDIENGYPKITTKHIQPVIDGISEYFEKKNFTIVSSGAVGFGMSVLNLKSKPKELANKQAAAAIGQNKLMNMYDGLFSKYNKSVAQVLLTPQGIMQRKHYLNAANTLNALFKMNVVPIINENDTVSVEELKFGDNDKLAAMVSSMINADLLILLTNIDGLLRDVNDKNSLIEDVYEIDNNLLSLCSCESKSTTTGGMKSKLTAAEIVMSSGIPMIICNAETPEVIKDILQGNFHGTYFHPAKTVLCPRKRWIKYSVQTNGKIYIDKGASDAVVKHKSLLSSGVQKISGIFDRGECVSIHNENREKIAAGLVNYNSEELNKIKGLKSSEIIEVLGYMDFKEVIHTDNMVLI